LNDAVKKALVSLRRGRFGAIFLLVNGAASVTNTGDAGASRGRLINKRGGRTVPIITASNA
jgi:hypothetical protein